MASFVCGGINEWYEMEIEEFAKWLDSARELQKI
jgi:hypothetical protein